MDTLKLNRLFEFLVTIQAECHREA